MQLQIGEWIEQESRDVTRCPSYYAADTETLRTRPGRYPLTLVVVGGYVHPMPYWLCTGIDSDRIAGRLYSGFGGLNFASTELPKEPATLTLQMYVSELAALVAGGRAEVKPEFAGLVADHKEQLEWSRRQTWESLRALAEQEQAA